MKIRSLNESPVSFKFERVGIPAKQELKEEKTTTITKKEKPYQIVISNDNGDKYTLFIPDSEMLTFLIENGYVVEETEHDFLPYGGKYYTLNDELCTAIMEFFRRKHQN